MLPNEDRDAFEAFHAGLVADLRPVGELEELLADRVVCSAWRLRRAVRVEALLLSYGDYGQLARNIREETDAHGRMFREGVDRSEIRGRYISPYDTSRHPQPAVTSGTSPATTATSGSIWTLSSSIRVASRAGQKAQSVCSPVRISGKGGCNTMGRPLAPLTITDEERASGTALLLTLCRNETDPLRRCPVGASALVGSLT